MLCVCILKKYILKLKIFMITVKVNYVWKNILFYSSSSYGELENLIPTY